VSAPGGQFVPGSYSAFVHNYQGTPEFDVSNARMNIFQGGTQLGSFPVNAASGSPSADYWRVFNFTLTSSGQITLQPVQTIGNDVPTFAPVPRRKH
jgi:hypothetical protein